MATQFEQETTTSTLEAAEIQIKPLLEQFDILFPEGKITDDEGMNFCATVLSDGRGWLAEQDAARTSLVKPLNDHVKWINAQFKEKTGPVSAIVAQASRMMGKRQQELEAEAEAENKRLQAEAEQQTESSPIPEAIAPIQQAPAKQVQTESGGKVSFKEVWKHEVLDVTKLPKTLKVAGTTFTLIKADDVVIRKLVNLGCREIKGCRIFAVKEPVRS